METLASLLGTVALAAPLTAPAAPATVTVPVGFAVKAGGSRLILVPGGKEVAAQPQPTPYRPVYLPYRQQDCNT